MINEFFKSTSKIKEEPIKGWSRKYNMWCYRLFWFIYMYKGWNTKTVYKLHLRKPNLMTEPIKLPELDENWFKEYQDAKLG